MSDPDVVEANRLQALEAYNVLDSESEDSFDRITRLASYALRVPIALVSLVDENRQWFKSRQGLGAEETPRDISFCTHAIQKNCPLVVTDATQDQRFRNNPLVKGDPNIRFYAGMPLCTPGGHNIGTLCVIDTMPRELSAAEIDVLSDLAKLVVDELELRQIATRDSLTGLHTRRSLETKAKREISRSRRYQRQLSCAILDIDHFKSINDRFGHPAGDAVLRAVAETCISAMRDADLVARLGGEEFVIMMPETSGEDALVVADRLRRLIEGSPVNYGGRLITTTSSFGVTELQATDPGIAAVLKRADEALYEAKGAGRNRSLLLVNDKLKGIAEVQSAQLVA
jgi:diguanylate cyclase (GGDEF)-like protein